MVKGKEGGWKFAQISIRFFVSTVQTYGARESAYVDNKRDGVFFGPKVRRVLRVYGAYASVGWVVRGQPDENKGTAVDTGKRYAFVYT